ncbi:MAG: molybdopterin-dependent oxidoreductase [Firmicutes bacterium]|nr:molybdopterin-dependent oxidoreductase [Bacillota bacterium]
MQPVTLTINRQEVSGHPGMTILELARESGINIPTICHHAKLAPIGACRFCLVENEQNGALLASCVTPIAPGMIINTESPRVLEHRKMILKLILASHPDSCLVCDKGNQCQLRLLAADLGIGLIELDRIPQPAVTEEVNPFIVRDMSKCILCARCIRACQELVIEGALDYFGRGFKAKPATLNNFPLEYSECTFCGTCVALCPTGALMEKEALYRGAIGDAVQTTCPYCGCGCSISLEIKDNQVARVKPAFEEQDNQEALCVKGSYGCDFIHSPKRLTKPLIKVNGDFQEASWEEALAVVAGAFNKIKKEHGADSLAVLGSANCTNEENYLLQMFARCVLGTNNIDNGSSLYYNATLRAFSESFGFPGITHSLKDLEQAEVILLIGASPEASAPLVNYLIKRAVKLRGAKLIVIDPRRTKLTFFADCWLQPKVGTDLALLNSLAKVIIEENLIDHEFVARKTDKFQLLAEILGNYPLEMGEAVTGVGVEQIRQAARLYAAAGKAAIIYGTGITQQALGVESVKALINLTLLTGNIWRKGGGLHALQRDCNAQGACDMGALPDYLPGYQHVGEAEARNIFETRWDVILPSTPGAGALEIIRQSREGKIKGLYITGENPLAGFPQAALVKEALATLEFLVVQDLFLTETAKLAKVVLPAAGFAEKEGTFTNLEGKVQVIRKAIDPVGESMPDWEIILQLAGAMGKPLPFSSLQQVMDEIRELVPLYRNDRETNAPEEEDLWDTRFDYKLPLKTFPGFSLAEYAPPAGAPDDSYPYILLAETSLYRSGSGVRSTNSRRLSKYSSSFKLRINEVDAQKMGLSSGDQVRVVSPDGQLQAAVEITGSLPEGTVALPRSVPEHPVTGLFSSLPEAAAKTSARKTCYVRIERS